MDDLVRALNDMSDDFGLALLDDVLAAPDRYVYRPDEADHGQPSS